MAKKSKKLPKKIAGVKVPKTLRKSAPVIGGLLKSNAGREAVAAGLVAMAGALAGTKKGRKVTADAAEGAKDAATTAGGKIADLAETAASGMSEAARSVMPSTSTGRKGGEDRPEPELATLSKQGRKSKDLAKLAKH